MTLPLAKQCVSLEIAKRMRDLGFPQESLFYWNVAHPEKAETKDEELSLKGISPAICYGDDWASNDGKLENYSAYTVGECGELLKDWIGMVAYFDFKAHDRTGETGDGRDWHAEEYGIYEATEANARGKLLITLKENGLI